MFKHLALAVMVVTTTITLPAQTWLKRSTVGPGLRSSFAMAYDPVNQGMLLFGGIDFVNRVQMGDTWLYKGGRWTKLNPPSSPPDRSGHYMVCDPVRRRVVLYGGEAPPTYYGDTWEWDGGRWTRTVNGTAVTPRWGNMTYDTNRRVVIKVDFHWNTTNPHKATQYNGNSWKPLPGTVPPIRSPVVYDSRRNCLVAMGVHVTISKLFEYRNGTWSLVTTQTPWQGTNGGSIFGYWPDIGNGNRGRTLLWGYSGGYHYHTWNGSTWQGLKTTPLNSQGVAWGFAYCPPRRSFILYLAKDLQPTAKTETWELCHAPSFEFVGRGCPGTNQRPQLTALASPTLGSPYRLHLWGALPTTPAALLIGLTDPGLSLGSLGAPGCTLHARPDWVLGFVTLTNGLWHSGQRLVLPHTPALLGGRIHAQFLVQDSGANRLGLITSNGGVGIVGY